MNYRQFWGTNTYKTQTQRILMERKVPPNRYGHNEKLPNTREINPTCARLSSFKTARTIIRKQTKISKIIKGIKSNCQAPQAKNKALEISQLELKQMKTYNHRS